jgi:FtsP/CotA-like multicopper oxidase with cupredoxin domain
MHGHEFQIIAKLPVQMSGNKPLGFNEQGVDYGSINIPAFPSRRDTIMVEKGSTIIVAIQSNILGVWALHCHNDFHVESGMFM